MPIIRGQSMLIYHLPKLWLLLRMEIASANIVSVVAGLQLDASKVNPQMTEDDLIASILVGYDYIGCEFSVDGSWYSS